MKKLFRRLGFRRMDEMEQYIAFRAQRNALLFLLIALFVWTVYEAYRVYAFDTMLNPFPCFLLSTAACIQIFSQLIMARNAVKDDEDSFETAPLLKIIIWICIVVGVVVTIGAALVHMSVVL